MIIIVVVWIKQDIHKYGITLINECMQANNLSSDSACRKIRLGVKLLETWLIDRKEVIGLAKLSIRKIERSVLNIKATKSSVPFSPSPLG